MKRIIITLMAIVLAVGMVGCGSLVKEKDGRTIVGDISFSTPSWERVEDTDYAIEYETDSGINIGIKVEDGKTAEDGIEIWKSVAADNNGNLYEDDRIVDGETVKGADAIYEMTEGTIGHVFLTFIERNNKLYTVQMVYVGDIDLDGDSLNEYREFVRFVESIDLD